MIWGKRDKSESTPETQAPSETAAAPVAALDPAALKEWLRPIEDPEILMSLVELGLVYAVRVDGSRVAVDMTLTSPACPAGPYILDQIRKRLLEYPGVTDAEVKIVWEPKWDPKTMASEEAKEALGLW